MSTWKIVVAILLALLVAGGGAAWYGFNYAELDIYVPLYAEHCGDCHGRELTGTDDGPTLLAEQLSGGDTVVELIQSIRAHDAFSESVPAANRPLTALDIKGLSIYVAERRLGQRFVDFRYYVDVEVPQSVQSSQHHDFRVETVVDGLEPLVFSIEPMPDGAWLVTEKERGLSVIPANGGEPLLVEGTPKTGGVAFSARGVQFGSGWLLDVALHPNYEENGWVYLHYTDLCNDACYEDDGDDAFFPASLNRVDRGRILDGRWQDVETVWQGEDAFYLTAPDTGAGGRLAFDDSGHVYLSVGIKEPGEGDDTAIGPQQLDKPFGKIHRVRDDGAVPDDNPYADQPGASFTTRTIWTYGHRSPQGLEWNASRGTVWNSEMGPRGGDELNELLPGRNYGWPFFSLGLEYSGLDVARHRKHALEFDTQQVEQTLVDITPSPAISSFAFYEGNAFPAWGGNVLIGSLKGSSLFRMAFEGTRLVERETLIKDLARIRDVEIGFDGLVYLLLESSNGSSIVRLVPADDETVASR